MQKSSIILCLLISILVFSFITSCGDDTTAPLDNQVEGEVPEGMIRISVLDSIGEPYRYDSITVEYDTLWVSNSTYLNNRIPTFYPNPSVDEFTFDFDVLETGTVDIRMQSTLDSAITVEYESQELHRGGHSLLFSYNSMEVFRRESFIKYDFDIPGQTQTRGVLYYGNSITSNFPTKMNLDITTINNNSINSTYIPMISLLSGYSLPVKDKTGRLIYTISFTNSVNIVIDGDHDNPISLKLEDGINDYTINM